MTDDISPSRYEALRAEMLRIAEAWWHQQGDDKYARTLNDCGYAIKHALESFPSETANMNPANPERRSSLEHSEVKPDGNEGRSGEVDREGGGSTATARGYAVGAGRPECGSRPSGGEANGEGLTTAGGAVSAPSGAVVHYSGLEGSVSFACGIQVLKGDWWSQYQQHVTCPKCKDWIASAESRSKP
jgi:hypothetical protein